MKKQKINSVYLVSEYLKNNKKAYIHKMKRVCKANNVGERISQLRKTYNWNIATIYEGVKDGIRVYHYKLIKQGKPVKKHLN